MKQIEDIISMANERQVKKWYTCESMDTDITEKWSDAIFKMKENANEFD